jgi:hypothetical protein
VPQTFIFYILAHCHFTNCHFPVSQGIIKTYLRGYSDICKCNNMSFYLHLGAVSLQCFGQLLFGKMSQRQKTINFSGRIFPFCSDINFLQKMKEKECHFYWIDQNSLHQMTNDRSIRKFVAFHNIVIDLWE